MDFARSSLRALSVFSLLAAVQAHPRLSHKRGVTFTREGCFVDDDSQQHALTGPSTADDSMTVESCASFCFEHRYFGLESGNACYCGDSYLADRAPDTDCAARCAGKRCQTCGGSSRLDIFTNLLYATPTLPSSVSSAVSSSLAANSSTPLTVTSPPPANTSTSDILTTPSPSATTTTPLASTAAVPTTAESSATPSSHPPSTSPSSTTEPAISTPATSCDPVSTWIGYPATCWASMPTVCASLTRSPAIPWPAVTAAASGCRNAFVAGTTHIPAVTSCFADVSRPTFSAASAYRCVQGASVLCSSSTLPCGAAAATSAAPAATNVLSDGGFESGGMGAWAYSSSSGADGVIASSVTRDLPYNGRYSLETVFSNSNGGSRMWYQDFSLEPGAAYQASWWWYSTNSAASTSSRMQFVGGGTNFLKEAPTSGGATHKWVQVTQTFTAGASFGRIYFLVYGNMGAAGNTFYVDDISISKVVA